MGMCRLDSVVVRMESPADNRNAVAKGLEIGPLSAVIRRYDFGTLRTIFFSFYAYRWDFAGTADNWHTIFDFGGVDRTSAGIDSEQPAARQFCKSCRFRTGNYSHCDRLSIECKRQCDVF